MAALIRRASGVSAFWRLPAVARSFSSRGSSFAEKMGQSGKSWQRTVAAVAGASVAVGAGYVWRRSSPPCPWVAECAAGDENEPAGKVQPGLPTFTRREISQHNTVEKRVWVTFKDGVYDITNFLPLHPGGSEKLMLAAGSAVDPYWQVFAQHNSEAVWEMLEEYRIGNIAEADRSDSTISSSQEGPYCNDPPRSPVLKVNTKEPFNAETPPVLLSEAFITPNDLFFVRNHLPVPKCDPVEYALEVAVEGSAPVKFSLEELKTKFPQHTVTATLQCAGNRREELNRVKEVRGLAWTGGAIGNATWTGVKLKDVLEAAGLEPSQVEEKIRHVHFEGLDRNPLTGQCYGASIPVEKAMDPRGDCLLAHTMNDAELPRDHGYPVRVVVPGTVGARNVKWVSRVVASHEEYDGQWQQRDYKGFSPSVDWSNVDFTKAPAIQELPVQSLICSPAEGTVVGKEEEEVTVQGIAWSGGGRAVVRVDVSADGGATWTEAELKGDAQRPRRAWAWTLWEVTLPLKAAAVSTQLCCKAVDDSYNVQPDTTAPIWNLRGCLSNAWHRVNITRK